MINSIINEPYKIIWWSIPIISGISIIRWNYSIDIQMHDTYFVINSFHAGILFAIVLFIIGGIYWLVKSKKLIDSLTIVHITITIFLFLSIVIFFAKPDVVKMALDQNNSNFEAWKLWNQMIIGGILVWVLSQLIFLVNLVISLIRNEENLNE